MTAISITGVLALMFFLQSRLVYFPDGQIVATPRDRGMAYEEVSFEAADGVQLSAWYVPSEAGRGVVLFSHGNGGNISYNLPFVEILHRVGLSTFIYDYRGYGRSKGKPTEEGTYSDIAGAWRYLTESRKVPAGQILLYGQSQSSRQRKRPRHSSSIPPSRALSTSRGTTTPSCPCGGWRASSTTRSNMSKTSGALFS
jgi:hypothetical protein